MGVLTEAQVQKFKTIVREKTGKEMSDDEARAQAYKYMGFVKMILQAADEQEKAQAGSN